MEPRGSPASGFAFYSEPDQAALTTPQGTTTLDVATGETHGDAPDRLKAFLQELYTYLGKL